MQAHTENIGFCSFCFLGGGGAPFDPFFSVRIVMTAAAISGFCMSLTTPRSSAVRLANASSEDDMAAADST